MEQTQKIVVTAFIYNQGKVLIIKRSEKEAFYPGVYELPGGKLNFGENPLEGLKREVNEEVSLEITQIVPYWVFSYVTKNDTNYTVEIVFLAKLLKTPNPILSSGHVDFAWIGEVDISKFGITDEIKVAIAEGFKITKKLN